MHYDSQVFRPPQEAHTPLLQVTHGCSYNRCTYCNMYDRNPFRVSSWSDIEADIAELAATGQAWTRIFLVNGDPFCLSTEQLVRIIDAIQARIPAVTTISMYASIRNVMTKSDEDLKLLRARGVEELYMGVESGYTRALEAVNKGYTGEEARHELLRLEAAVIAYSQGVMLGLLGAGHGTETGEANAEFFNGLRPKAVWMMSTTVMPGTILAQERDAGRFQEASEYERVQEIRAFLTATSRTHSMYFNSIHPTNTFRLEGYLPEDTARLIAQCDEVLQRFSAEDYNRQFDRARHTRL